MALSAFKQSLAGLFGVHGSSTASAKDAADRAYKHTVTWEIPADTNAATNITDEYFWTTETNVKLKAVTLLPDAAANANATNYAILNVKKADGAGGTASVVANVATTATNLAAGVPYDLTIQSTDIDAGEVLAFGAGKGGSGVDLPTGKLIVTVEEI